MAAEAIEAIPYARGDGSAAGSDFSLFAGGLLYRVALSLRLVRAPLGLLSPGIILAVTTWGPLLVLSTFEGRAFGEDVRVPFLASVSTHTRFLIAIPLLFAAEAWVDPRLRHWVDQIVRSRLVPSAQRPALDAAIRTVSRRRDSVAVEAILLGLAVVLVASGVRVDLPGDIASWRAAETAAGLRPTAAGWWYAAVAIPVFRFLLLRWCWRLVVWGAFLWRVSRLDLELNPLHPDLAGGLGHLGVAQSHFSALSSAASAVLAGIFAEEMLFAGRKLETLTLPLVAIVLVNLAIFLGPLLLFAPRLLTVKRQGLRQYGILAADYTRRFERKWIRGEAAPDEPILGSADIQSLADLAGSFETIRHMRVVPFGPGLVVSILGATLLPMVPLLLLAFPLDELVVKTLRLLLGV